MTKNNNFQSLSEGFATAVKSADSHLVRVLGRRRMAATGIIWPEQNVIVTANHVVHHDEEIKVGLPDGTIVPATLVGRDPSTDLAVLKIESDNLTPITLAETTPQVGNLVLALGRAHGQVQATLGVISTVGDAWRTPFGGQIDQYIQTDVVMLPGFSGGALINASGDLIGLNSSGLSRGASITLPHATVSRVVNTLLEHGHIKRGYLGVTTQLADLPATVVESLERKSGLLVSNIAEDSPAKDKLLVGDTIVSVNGEAVADHEGLLMTLMGNLVGKTVPVEVVRGGKLQSADITIGERPISEDRHRRKKGRGRRHHGHGGRPHMKRHHRWG